MMSRFNNQFAVVSFLIAILINVTAFAASPDIIAAIKARQANYKEIGGDFKAISDELKNSAPDAATIRPLAKDLYNRASGQLQYFQKGSGPESGAQTRAKVEIWNDETTFKMLHTNMVDAAATLQQASVAGDVAMIAAARKELGAACKACHDQFREPE